MPEFRMRHFTSGEAGKIFDPLVALYLEVYADSDDEFDNEDRYRRQLSSHMTAAGFSLVCGYLDEEMIGYTYGFPLQENARWWLGLRTPVAPELIAETGDRTFALCEIMVRPAFQGRSFGHALHDELLAGRPEERATLLAEPDEPAHAFYLRWGWKTFAQLQPGWEHSPVFDSMLLPLPVSRWSHSR